MSTAVFDQLNTEGVAPSLPERQAESLAAELSRLCGMKAYPRSIMAARRSLFFLAAGGEKKFLGVLSGGDGAARQFEGESKDAGGEGKSLSVCETNSSTAARLRSFLPFLAPRPLGLKKSIGCGDRLGLATPGHIRAVRGSGVAPIFAQQSMRENARTGRTPQEVMDDAMWGAFEEGWREGFGADADHLKTTADIDVCAAAGYTFYTIDPGEYVDNAAASDPPEALRKKVKALPWDVLESSTADLQRALAKRAVDLGSFSLTIGEEELLRAAAKYGKAVAHTVTMQRHLQQVMGGRPYELEMSVDETESVSTLAEHIYIAHELRRLGVRCVSLAPRYVGTFEKGADYIGDLGEFERSFAAHLAVAKTFGPYKLSLHSGSDKFSVYPIAARLAGELVHLKTAGTSYLEALRAVATIDPALFRRIVPFAIERYPEDRATYHVSAEVEKIPAVDSVPDSRLPSLLDDFHAREVLHVTFGSVINDPRFRGSFFTALRGHEETYYEILERHFRRHLAPFAQAAGGARPS